MDEIQSIPHAFEDKHVNVKLRLKLFDSIITSTVSYGLDTVPLTHQMLNRLDIAQRTMLRRIVGWVNYADDTWEESGRRMAERLRQCLALRPVKNWSECINERKVKMIESQHEWPYWTKFAIEWSPFECAELNYHRAYRSPGRPRQRWDDI